ncbi:MAG: hemerythrin domain-containing protein [Candidatus Melainabacteria bacterium]|nr:hemerythrin domain-containing protein [Candidatus Melainabacteria bacterium]
MDLFNYFEEEHKYIEERLSELEENYESWSAERVFVRATKMFEAIAKHFEKQESFVLEEIRNYPSMQTVIAECIKDRKIILDAIDDLLMDHIDSSEFRGNLGKLLKAVRRHITFSDEELYKAIRANVPEKNLSALNNAVKEKMFS